MWFKSDPDIGLDWLPRGAANKRWGTKVAVEEVTFPVAPSHLEPIWHIVPEGRRQCDWTRCQGLLHKCGTDGLSLIVEPKLL